MDRYSVNGLQMACRESGSGDPIVFLHGNPTSSYLWRDVMPGLETRGRCIAPDLIGMGQSDKLPNSGPGSYSFAQHSEYLDALFDALELGNRVTLVVHDWGSALGFDWARRHPDRVRAIAYMEAIVKPMSWTDWPESIRPLFEGLRSTAGENMILEKNIFVERVLPGSIQRQLSAEEMAVYRAPFEAAGEDRRPTLTWPRQIPLDGEPADVVERVAAYAEWLSGAELPKLFVNADPGAILVGEQREFCRAWPNQREVTVPGIHFIQEDSGRQIGELIANWLNDLT